MRYAPKMSMDDFKSTIVSLAISKDFEADYGPIKGTPDYGRMIYDVDSNMPKACSDWDSEIEFSRENIEIEDFYMTNDGVPFILLCAGGDWEMPLALALYFDGTDFRGYIPNDGNVFNKALKTAFGNDDSDDAEGKKLIALLGNNVVTRIVIG